MKFSIITITYNRAHLIVETMASVLKQTYQNFEMIIVDDGSTDNTESIVSAYVEKYGAKFRYIKCEKIGKPSALRNIAIKNATGDIISILDSDDLWLSSKLEEMHAVFSQKKEVQFIFHNLQHFVKVDQLKPVYYKYPKSFYKNIMPELLKGEILAFPVFSMRYSLVKELGPFDEDVLEGQQEYYLKAAALYDIYYLNKPLTLMRRHEENLTRNFEIIHALDAITTYDKLKKAHWLTKKQYIMASNFMNYKIAKYYLEQDEQKKALYHLKTIFAHNTLFNKWYLKAKLLRFIT